MIKNILAVIGFGTVMYGVGKVIDLIVKIKVQEELQRQRDSTRASAL